MTSPLPPLRFVTVFAFEQEFVTVFAFETDPQGARRGGTAPEEGREEERDPVVLWRAFPDDW